MGVADLCKSSVLIAVLGVEDRARGSSLSTSQHGTKPRGKPGSFVWIEPEPKRMVADRRYDYGDPKSLLDFAPA
jgi:hypothetical protein